MDNIELRKRTVFKRYHDSDIFNLKNDSKFNKSSNPSKNRTTQGSLEKTKNDLFNTLENQKTMKAKQHKKKIFVQNYLNTDIFKSDFMESDREKNKKQRKNINASSCFDGVLNNEEYKKDLNNYTNAHRSKKKDYNVDKYFNKISAIGRYYNELYGDEKSGVFPPNKIMTSKTMKNSPNKKAMTNSVFKNNLKDFETRKRKIKINNINFDLTANGKNKLYNSIEHEKNKNVSFHKKKVDLYGQNLDNKNNKNIIKNIDGIKYNSKLYKQLEIQSNIFGEENKDINSKMYNHIKNKKEEIENKIKLKEKIKKEKEEINNKINEQNKKNSTLNKNIWGGTHCKWQKSNMDWKDPGAQILFKRTKTIDDLKNAKEETAFQRKIIDMGDSDNIDIISDQKKFINIDIDKFRTKKIINNENNVEQSKEILNTMPNSTLNTYQKIRIINNDLTTSNFLNNSTNENLNKMFKRINNNIKSARLSKSKNKKDNFIKIMGKNSNIKEKYTINTNINKKMYDDYSLIYSTKANNTLDKFNNLDIKKIFGEKGVHIFDIKKNELSIGDMNKIKFKIRENEDENIKTLEQKIKLVEIDLNKNKYKVKIKKEEDIKKRVIKNNKEKEMKNINNKNTLIKKKKNLISRFPVVDLKYKNMSNKK